jgi:acyl carrier protein
VSRFTAQAELLEIQEKLLNFIIMNFHVQREDINLEESLIDTGIIDSMGLIEILAFFEEEFSIVTEEDQMTKNNLGSIQKMVAFVMKEMDKVGIGAVSKQTNG